MKIVTIILCICLYSLYANPVVATAENLVVEFPNGKPTEPTVHPNPRSKDLFYAVVVHEDITVYESPDIDSKSITLNDQWLNVYVIGDTVPPIKHGNEVDKVHEFEEDDFLLLTTTDDEDNIIEIFGWVQKKDLQTKDRADMTENLIYKKAFIINHWRNIKEGEEQDLKVLSTINSLHTERSEVRKLQLFGIYFIFQTQKDSDGKKYFLLGHEPTINFREDISMSIVGWVPTERVLCWNTRQALHFNKTNIDNRIVNNNMNFVFKNKKDIESWYRGRNRPEDGQDGAPMGTEIETQTTELPYNVTRFPIIDEPVYLPDLGCNVIKIGYIGDTITSDGRITTTTTATDMAEFNAKLDQLRKTVKNIDINFVLDTTMSMGPAFIHVKTAINEAVDLLQSKYSDLNVRFGLTMFKDFPDKEKTYLFDRMELRNDPSDLLKVLEKEEECGGDDAAGASFFAVQKTLQLSEFLPNTLNALFLITDAPNKPEGGYTIETLVSNLNAKNTLFFPVIEHKSKGAIEEAQEAIDNLKQNSGYGEVIVTDFEDPSTGKLLTKTIDKIYDSSEILSMVCNRAKDGAVHEKDGIYYYKLLDGDTGPLGFSMSARFQENKVPIYGEGYILDSSPEYKGKYRLLKSALEDLKAMGVQETVLEKLKGVIDKKIYDEEEFKKQHIDNVLSVKERELYENMIMDVADMATLIEYYVLIDKQTLLEVLHLLVRMVGTPMTVDKVEDLWVDAIEFETMDGDIVTLDDLDEEKGETASFKTLMEKYAGLPVKEEILSMTLPEIGELSSRNFKALVDRLVSKRNIITDIITEQNFVRTVVLTDEGKERIKVVNRGPKTYFFDYVDGGAQFCWIKRKYLP